jgi:hypothetical protein
VKSERWKIVLNMALNISSVVDLALEQYSCICNELTQFMMRYRKSEIKRL